MRLGHNCISVLYQRCIAVYAPSKNVPSRVCQCAKHQWIRFWHNRTHYDVTEVEAVGFLPLSDAVALGLQDRERTHICRECFERTGKQVLTARNAYFGTSSWPTSASTFVSVGILFLFPSISGHHGTETRGVLPAPGEEQHSS